eukprot:tig00000157_g9674.t1
MVAAEAGGAPSAARKRWSILRGALLREAGSAGGGAEADDVSVRRHAGFGLIPRSPAASDGPKDPQFEHIAYELPGGRRLLLRQRVAASPQNFAATLNDFRVSAQSGVDNTGNVCLWPAEEVLAYYIVSNPALFRDTRVCELGAGVGLASFALAAAASPARACATDGNPLVVENLAHNAAACGADLPRPLEARCLPWQDPVPPDMRGAFDWVLAADCCFFEQYHDGLLETVWNLLAPCTPPPHSSDDPDETPVHYVVPRPPAALFVAPRRGRTLENFVRRASERGFDTELREEYDGEVWRRHEAELRAGGGRYDPGLHYPLLLVLTPRRFAATL